MTVTNPGGSGGASFTQGTAAAKPAATPNALYFATDTGEWWVANAAGNAWQSIAQTSATSFQVATSNWIKLVTGGTQGIANSFGNSLVSDGTWNANQPVHVGLVGSGLKIAEGTNAKQGVSGAMVGGTVTVANTSVTASSRILLGIAAPGGTVGAPFISAVTAGTGFTIKSTSSSDTSTVAYEIFEPG
jgi:hypothetical protein